MPYLDTVGKWTIGVGRNLTDNGISKQEAMLMLDDDITIACEALDKSLPWWRSMSDARQSALVDMCFNMGINRLLGFAKSLEAMKSGKYADAAAEMLDSAWASQVGVRAKTLATMMEAG